MPFWHGTNPGVRSSSAARWALTRTLRGIETRGRPGAAPPRRGPGRAAAANLVSYLDEQMDATGAVPDDRTVVVERFRDEVGDWRMCVLSPFGSRVHAPWAMATEARMLDRFGPGAQVLWSDDGIVVRLPEAVDGPAEELLFDPDAIEQAVVQAVPQTAMFASVFREAAARALLLPVADPDNGRRSGSSASARRISSRRRPSSRTSRSCWRPPGNASATCSTSPRSARSWRPPLPAHRARRGRHRARVSLRAVAALPVGGRLHVRRRRPARGAARRRVDPRLRPAPRALGSEEAGAARPRALDEVEAELQRLGEGRVPDPRSSARPPPHARRPHRGRHPWPRGGRRRAGVGRAASSTGGRPGYGSPGTSASCAREDAARLRDALGPPRRSVCRERSRVRPTGRSKDSFGATPGPTDRSSPRRSLLARRVHRAREEALAALGASDAVVRGEFRPGDSGREWCDPDVLRRLRRRSLSLLRREVEPVDASALGRFLPRGREPTARGGRGRAPRRDREAPGHVRPRVDPRDRRPCSRAGCAATVPPISTRSWRAATWPGSAPGRSGPTMVGSRSCSVPMR